MVRARKLLYILVAAVVVLFVRQLLNRTVSQRRRPTVTPQRALPNCTYSSTIKRDEFQPVDDGRHTFVFSAYMDVDDGVTVVRVVGLTLLDAFIPNLTCCVSSKTTVGDHAILEVATKTAINEDHGFNYTATYFICPIGSRLPHPTHVSVVSTWSRGIQNQLVIVPAGRANVSAGHYNNLAGRGITAPDHDTVPADHDNVPGDKDRIPFSYDTTATASAAYDNVPAGHGNIPQKNFTVCIPPLQDNYDRIHELVEFVEVNRIFGADFFVFYLFSATERIRKALDVLVEEGLAEVVKWNLPDDVAPRIHYFGQLVAMNDCLYRQRYKTRFIVNSDMDELVVPRNGKNWMSVINPVLEIKPQTAAFYIRSYVFCLCWENHQSDFKNKNVSLKYNISTLLKTNRQYWPLPPNIRQKYIYDPKGVEMAGIHFLWRFKPNFGDFFVSPEECSLHHYRTSAISEYRELPVKMRMTVDMYMHQFQEEIATRVLMRWQLMKPILRSSAPHV